MNRFREKRIAQLERELAQLRGEDAPEKSVPVAFASDAAAKLAAESGIDQSLIVPTGATGATKADVERALNAK